MNRSFYVLTVITTLIGVSFSENAEVNNFVEDARNLQSDDLLWNMLNTCISSEVKSVLTCLKLEVRNHDFVHIFACCRNHRKLFSHRWSRSLILLIDYDSLECLK